MCERKKENVYKLASDYYKYEYPEDKRAFKDLPNNERSSYVYWLKWRLTKRLKILIGYDVFDQYISEPGYFDLDHSPTMTSQSFEKFKFNSKEEKEYHRELVRQYNIIKKHDSILEERLDKLEYAKKKNASMQTIENLQKQIKQSETTIKKYQTLLHQYISNKTLNRLNKIDEVEIKCYYNILVIMDPKKYPGINLIRNLKSNKWEVLSKNDRETLLLLLKMLDYCPNWDDIIFDYDDIEDRIMHPIKYRAFYQAMVIQDVLNEIYTYRNMSEEYSDEFANKVLQRTRSLYKEAEKIREKNYQSINEDDVLSEIKSHKAMSPNPET